MIPENQKRILLVEDEPILALTQKMVLEKYGYTILIVNSGEKAVDLVKKDPAIHLILMDIDLGKGIDGTEAAALILKEKDIPVVFCSSHTEPEIVEKTEKITSYGYVVKSSSNTVLDASIKMAFKLFAAKQQGKKNQEILQESERMLRDSQAVANIGSYVTNLKEGVLSADTWKASPEIYKIFGINPDYPHTVDAWLEIIHPDSREDVYSYRRRVISERNRFDRQYQIIRMDIGQERWIQEIGELEYDGEGYPVRLIGTIQDITEKKLVEISLQMKNEEYESLNEELRATVEDLQAASEELQAASEELQVQNEELQQTDTSLRESQERFKALHNASFGGITIHDKGIILECNQGLSEITGFSVDELIGMNGLLLISEQTRDLVLKNILNGYEKPYEAIGVRKNGEEYPLRLEARGIPYKGKMVRVVEFRDISDTKLADKALRESEEDLRETQSIAHLGSWRLEFATNQVHWSDELYRMYGFDPALPPPPFSEHASLFTDESWTRLSASIANTVEKGDSYQLELETVRKDGSTGWMWVYGRRLVNSSGKAVGMAGAAQDITERKNTEEQIKSLLAEKELILKEVHHRIKNNMNTMQGLLALQAESLQDPFTRMALEDAGRRMQSMGLLYEKLYQAEGFTQLSVRSYFPSLVEEITANFPAKRFVRIEKHIDEFVLDTKRLQPLGILLNELLTNAMKYAFNGKNEGKISVEITLVEGIIFVSVSDNGSGIPESVDFARSTGFGLTLVHSLAAQLKGDVRIERGNGTRIILEFAQ